MSDSEVENHMKSTKLTSTNYNVWTVALQGKLMTVNTWQIITKKLKKSTDGKEAEKWLLKKEEAAGILLKSLSPMQYVHIEGIMDDPIVTWKRLRAAHQSQVANSCFHTVQKLLNMCKDNTESLTDYITCINTTTNDLIVLAPSTLIMQNIINEIGIHVALMGLDQTKYRAFTSSLLLISTLDCTTMAMVF